MHVDSPKLNLTYPRLCQRLPGLLPISLRGHLAVDGRDDANEASIYSDERKSYECGNPNAVQRSQSPVMIADVGTALDTPSSIRGHVACADLHMVLIALSPWLGMRWSQEASVPSASLKRAMPRRVREL